MDMDAGKLLALANHHTVRAEERKQGAYYVGQAGQVIAQKITVVQTAI